MYNSNKDLFLNQSWSQGESQDWSIHLPSSQSEFAHQVPSTPTRVLPPTPSSSGLQGHSMSSGWLSRNASQVNGTPQKVPMMRAPSKESIFSKEIRFALHALLSVVKELPDKLKEVVLNGESRSPPQDALFENIRKILDEKMAPLDALLSLPESSEEFADGCRKSHDLVQNRLEKFHEVLSSQGEDMASFQGTLALRTDALAQRMTALRKVYLKESKKLLNLLTAKRDETENIEMSAKIDSVVVELQALTKTSAECSEEVARLIREEEDKEKSVIQNKMMSEILSMKKLVQELPCLISASIKGVILEHLGERPTEKQHNVRVAPAPWDFRRKNHPALSPVARVTPQIQAKTSTKRPHDVDMKKGHIFDVMEYASSSDESTQFQPSSRRLCTQNATTLPTRAYKDTQWPSAKWTVNNGLPCQEIRPAPSVLSSSCLPPDPTPDSGGFSQAPSRKSENAVYFSRPQTRFRHI